MRRILIAAALVLGGCQQASEQSAANEVVAEPSNADANMIDANMAASNSAEPNPLDRILAMRERERNVVFIRALLDEHLPCEGVKKSTLMPERKDMPTWYVECVDGASHVIGVTRDGIAHIASRSVLQ